MLLSSDSPLGAIDNPWPRIVRLAGRYAQPPVNKPRWPKPLTNRRVALRNTPKRP